MLTTRFRTPSRKAGLMAKAVVNSSTPISTATATRWSTTLAPRANVRRRLARMPRWMAFSPF